MSAARFLRPDSPWLWVGLFAIVGLCGVLIIAPKYSDRRARLDLQFQGRQRAMEETSNKALEAANQQPTDRQAGASTNSLLWFVGAIVGGCIVLAGFAAYVFRGGYLRAPRMIDLPETEPTETTPSDAATSVSLPDAKTNSPG